MDFLSRDPSLEHCGSFAHGITEFQATQISQESEIEILLFGSYPNFVTFEGYSTGFSVRVWGPCLYTSFKINYPS